MNSRPGVEFRVGIFVLTALAIGGTLTFVIGEKRDMFTPTTDYYVIYDTVEGLRGGSPVLVGGVSVGSVSRVQFTPDAKVRVDLTIVDESRHLIREDSTADIGNKGMLGDRLVDIRVGRGKQLRAGGQIPAGKDRGIASMLARVGPIADKAEAVVENLTVFTGRLSDEQFTEDLQATTHNVAEITKQMAEGQGTLGRMLSDPQMGRDVARTVANIERLTQQLSPTAERANAILREVQSGDGTAHDIIYGESGKRLVKNLADATGELSTMLATVRTGDSTAHDIIYENEGAELMENLTAASGDIRAVMADVRAGRGTIGGLLVDPSIYEDVKRLVGDLQRNEILRALVRYSIRADEAREPPRVTPATP